MILGFLANPNSVKAGTVVKRFKSLILHLMIFFVPNSILQIKNIITLHINARHQEGAAGGFKHSSNDSAGVDKEEALKMNNSIAISKYVNAASWIKAVTTAIERRNKGIIKYVEDMEGNSYSRSDVGVQFVKCFEKVLGRKELVGPIHGPVSLFVNKLSMDDDEFMVRPVSLEEIKGLFLAILDFFSNGKILKEVNDTVIALVPKTQTPKRVADFRPVSCCNVVYKCISKIIANRLKGVLNSLVDDCHSAFIPSIQISDNIMLSQELMRNYHRNSGPSKVAFKFDIQKAYDSVNWGFLRQCLIQFGFPWRMINWIMSCMTSSSFTVSVNGEHYGYFKGMRGLRQGDPLSPYLFTLVMEVLSLLLKKKIQDSDC
ncbi:RNA-directed DNA polymerase, eukaryota, reverse transcriptase zinc-binding domain protein [Tanacetum coccineum]